MTPRCIDRVAFAWDTDSTESTAYYLRSQPVWPNNPTHGLRWLVGWKIYTQIEAAAESGDQLGMRVDIGGGQVQQETNDARPLWAWQYPTRCWTPCHATASTESQHQPGILPIADRGWWRDWLGCNSCFPIDCDEQVRLLIRPSRSFVWSAQVNLVLWIATP